MCLLLQLMTVCFVFVHIQVSQETQRREEADSIWEAQCTLTLWLAQLVLIPFDLASVDSSITANATRSAVHFLNSCGGAESSSNGKITVITIDCLFSSRGQAGMLQVCCPDLTT